MKNKTDYNDFVSPRYTKTKSFKTIIDENVKIAKELRYPKYIIEKIKHAKTESEIYRYMKNGRDNL